MAKAVLKCMDTVQAFLDATRHGYEDCIADPDAAADVLLEASPELDEELVRASQEYLADQYQADADAWGVIDQGRWDAFFGWVGDQEVRFPSRGRSGPDIATRDKGDLLAGDHAHDEHGRRQRTLAVAQKAHRPLVNRHRQLPGGSGAHRHGADASMIQRATMKPFLRLSSGIAWAATRGVP